MANALPDELLLDIFERLPDPVDLLRCVGTCKRWLRVVTADNAAFLRRAGVLPENRKASLLLGAFYQNDHLEPGLVATVNKLSDCVPRFWRLDNITRPGIGLFSKHDILFNYAKPLASRCGLLLVRLMPVPLDYRKIHLAVCHPLLGGVHHLPPPLVHLHPSFRGRDLTGYALITGYGGEGLDNHRQRPLAFRVLFTAVHHLDGVVYACSYSSATGNWSAPIMCPLELRGLTMSGPRAGVVDNRGTTYWLYRGKTSFYTLDVSADAAHVSLTKMPMQVLLQPPFPCIARGGKLSFVLARTEGNHTLLQLWTKQEEDGNGGGWLCSDLFITPRPYDSFRIIGFAESRGAILVKGCAGLIYFGIENKELEQVRGSDYNTYPMEVCSNSECQGYNSCTKCTYNNCVLYEMDWSSYLLKLSAWSQKGGETDANKICQVFV